MQAEVGSGPYDLAEPMVLKIPVSNRNTVWSLGSAVRGWIWSLWQWTPWILKWRLVPFCWQPLSIPVADHGLWVSCRDVIHDCGLPRKICGQIYPSWMEMLYMTPARGAVESISVLHEQGDLHQDHMQNTMTAKMEDMQGLDEIDVWSPKLICHSVPTCHQQRPTLCLWCVIILWGH